MPSENADRNADGRRQGATPATRRRQGMPDKATHHARWHGIGFKARTLVFVACVLFMMAFVLVSFGIGAGNGQWLYDAAATVMGWTFLRFASALQGSGSVAVQTIGRGLETFVSIDIVAMFLATFVIAVTVTLAVTLVAGIVRTRHYAGDDGNVALLRGYDRQYRMGQMLR